MKVKITERALLARINRKLKQSGEVCRKARGARAVQDLGDYFILDIGNNTVTVTDCDLESLGRELQVLREFEEVTTPEEDYAYNDLNFGESFLSLYTKGDGYILQNPIDRDNYKEVSTEDECVKFAGGIIMNWDLVNIIDCSDGKFSEIDLRQAYMEQAEIYAKELWKNRDKSNMGEWED